MYAIVDIETTGGYASAHGITEVAVFIHDGSRMIKKFETLINPHQSIPRYIQALTGITDEMVADAPSFEEVAEVLYDLLRDKIFVAHNVNFDYSFVKHHLKAAGFELNTKKLCTVRLGKKVFPGMASYSLGNLCRALHISIDDRHRAGGDAKATVKLFERYLENNGALHIQQMLKKTSADQWLPLHLSKKDIEQLPSCPGVYYFLDAKDKIVYVGKAVNIRKRVSSHFTHNDPDRKRQNFLCTIYKIRFTECATELEATVLESAEIRRLWPRFNVSQKQPQQKFGLYMFEDNRGYIRLAIDKKKKNLHSLYNFNLLHEGLVMLRKMTEEFELHEKLCFLDKTPISENDLSFLDPPHVYNGRIKRALEALDEKLPTFAVIDEGKQPGEKLCLLVERGSFWGMGYLSEEQQLQSAEELKQFLQPYADNDTIRNSIYTFINAYPEKRVDLLQ